MLERNRALTAIAAIIEDYQAGIHAAPTPDHVNRWISQFPQDVQNPILLEMENVLSKTYFSKSKIEGFMRSVINYKAWTGENTADFWREMNFLNIQPRGSSQRELVALFDQELQKATGLSIEQCGQGNKFIYIDDGLFSGNRIKADLINWVKTTAPEKSKLYIALIALHSQGYYFANKDISKAIKDSGKNISVTWGKLKEIEDAIRNINTSDVLRPTSDGDNPAVAAYVATLGKPQTWRTGTNIGPLGSFTSSQGRQLLEQEFLKKGVEIRAMCPHLGEYQRPLGNTVMKTTGFGTMFTTYRNCPNNAPLVLWAGNPWYPLFRRVTN